MTLMLGRLVTCAHCGHHEADHYRDDHACGFGLSITGVGWECPCDSFEAMA